MKPIENYENMEAKGTGDFVPLTLGGHVCIIKKAYISETTTCKEQLCLELDLAEDGEFKDYYQKQFDNSTKKDKKWGCIYRQLTQESPEYFKGMITAIENSNPGFKFNWDENQLVGKKVGGVFGLEEYQKQDGKIGTITKCVRLRSADKVKDAQIPSVRLLNKSLVSYDEYMKEKETINQFTNGQVTNFDEDDLPF